VFELIWRGFNETTVQSADCVVTEHCEWKRGNGTENMVCGCTELNWVARSATDSVTVFSLTQLYI